MNDSIIDWKQYVNESCIAIAIKNGHTISEAIRCEGGKLKCKGCPYFKQEDIGEGE